MWTIRLSFGPVQMVSLLSAALVCALAILLILEWPVGLVPLASYALTSGAAYAVYRQHRRETAAEREEERARRGVRFRVVDTRGVCPLGRKAGETIAVAAGGVTSPVCEEARNVLLMAAASPDGEGARDWCCPVYDHLLVFRREEEKAAA